MTSVYLGSPSDLLHVQFLHPNLLQVGQEDQVLLVGTRLCELGLDHEGVLSKIFRHVAVLDIGRFFEYESPFLFSQCIIVLLS